ncbi:MAG: hypothetical protein LBI29_03295 [Rickettsiales bacterium]|jgi:hypothetical protein|nr:hypothetical protein [Rickettsiales bacterium]
MNVLIFSNDLFLISSLRTRFEREASVKVFDQNGLVEMGSQNIILFDSVGLCFVDEILTGLCLSGKLILNIGLRSAENAVNVRTPFRIDSILQKISNFIAHSRANTIFRSFGMLNFDEGTLVNGNTIIRFTEREMELIRTVEKGKITKKDLVRAVWGSKTQNDQVLETMFYKIKRKLAEGGMESFIKFSDGCYQIDDL